MRCERSLQGLVRNSASAGKRFCRRESILSFRQRQAGKPRGSRELNNAMLSKVLQSLFKMPPAQTREQYIQWLLSGLRDPVPGVRAAAQSSFANLCVNRHLDYTPDEVIAILHALQEQEGIRDLAWVLRHVEFVSEPSPVMKIPAEVQEAASQCLYRLRERTEQDYLANILLHPASAPPAGADTLLRPAQAGAQTRTANLLRASGSGETSEES